MIYTIDTVASQEFYDENYRRWHRKTILKPFLRFGLGLLCVFVAMLGFHALSFEGYRGFISGFWSASFCAYLRWFYLVNKRYNREFHDTSQLHVGKATRFELNNEGIQISAERYEQFYPWHAFIGLHQGDLVWFLGLTKWNGVFLPTDKLTEEIQRFITSKLATAYFGTT